MHYTEIFFICKLKKNHLKIFGILNMIAQNINCVYTLEPPRQGKAILTSTYSLCFGSKIGKKSSPVNPLFTILKWGIKEYTFIGRVFLMEPQGSVSNRYTTLKSQVIRICRSVCEYADHTQLFTS